MIFSDCGFQRQIFELVVAIKGLIDSPNDQGNINNNNPKIWIF